MRAFFQPSDGPPWLSRMLASIRAALGDAWDAPFGLWQVKTADLPAEAKFTGRIAWNADHARVTYSNGSAWKELQPYDATLGALAGFNANGFLVQTSAASFAGRTLQAPAAGLAIANPAGIAGDPAFALANDLAALEGLTGTGIARRTAADSWSVGTIVAVAEGGTGATSAKAAVAALRNGAMVRKSADQIGANYTTGPAIAWDAEVYDDDGWHDNGTNNTRLSVPPGVSRVRVGATIKITNGSTTSTIFLSLLRNGAVSFDGAAVTSFVAGQTGPVLSFASGPIPVTGGADYFELSLFYAADTSIDIGAAQSNFWIEAA